MPILAQMMAPPVGEGKLIDFRKPKKPEIQWIDSFSFFLGRNWPEKSFWQKLLEHIGLPKKFSLISARKNEFELTVGTGCWNIFALLEDQKLTFSFTSCKEKDFRQQKNLGCARWCSLHTLYLKVKWNPPIGVEKVRFKKMKSIGMSQTKDENEIFLSCPWALTLRSARVKRKTEAQTAAY